jgi:ABC-type transport system involved in multi-copper enzyme maturation permease subunit
MNTAIVTPASPEPLNSAPLAPQGLPWQLWRRQVAGVLRLEIRKNLRGGRALPLLLLAALPVGLLALYALLPLPEEAQVPALIFATAFRFYYLKVALFLGCLIVFIQLFRGDILDRSLHYYLLCPVRREVLVVAKYLVGVVATATVMAASTILSFVLVHGLVGGGFSLALAGQMLQYAGIAILGCVGYGALFMLAGLFFRNPVVPALALFIWELINPFLPALLKKLSVIHYLISLLPLPASSSALAVLATGTSPWLSIPALLAVTAGAIYLAGIRLRWMEIKYSEE